MCPDLKDSQEFDWKTKTVEFVVDSIRGKKYKYYSIRCTNIDAQHFRQFLAIQVLFVTSKRNNFIRNPQSIKIYLLVKQQWSSCLFLANLLMQTQFGCHIHCFLFSTHLVTHRDTSDVTTPYGIRECLFYHLHALYMKQENASGITERHKTHVTSEAHVANYSFEFLGYFISPQFISWSSERSFAHATIAWRLCHFRPLHRRT